MSSNTHMSMTKFRQEGVHEWQADEGSTDATNIAAAIDAQTEATLALAYEQRTANLMAFERSQWEAWQNDTLNDEGQRMWKLAADQIAERLDLS